MTPEKFTEKIAFHLRKHDICCPACGDRKKGWEIAAMFTRLPVLANTLQPRPDGTFPMVTARCKKCSNMLFIDADAIPGLIEHPKAIVEATEIPEEVKKRINLG